MLGTLEGIGRDHASELCHGMIVLIGVDLLQYDMLHCAERKDCQHMPQSVWQHSLSRIQLQLVACCHICSPITLCQAFQRHEIVLLLSSISQEQSMRFKSTSEIAQGAVCSSQMMGQMTVQPRQVAALALSGYHQISQAELE